MMEVHEGKDWRNKRQNKSLFPKEETKEKMDGSDIGMSIFECYSTNNTLWIT